MGKRWYVLYADLQHFINVNFGWFGEKMQHTEKDAIMKIVALGCRTVSRGVIVTHSHGTPLWHPASERMVDTRGEKCENRVHKGRFCKGWIVDKWAFLSKKRVLKFFATFCGSVPPKDFMII